MITPRFVLQQDENTVTIILRTPYCSLKELDISVDGTEFMFYCKPYHLRLNLPGQIEDDERTKTSWDSDRGEITFQFNKVNSGEHFENLELVTKFLQSKVDVVAEDGKRSIEILCNNEEAAGEEVVESKARFGFAMRGGYNFKVLSHDFCDLFEIDPEKVDLEERGQLKHKNEQENFDPDAYLVDLVNPGEIDQILQLNPPWATLTKSNIEFTSKELDFLKDLSNIAYNLSKEQVTYCHNSLLDILFAYCYDRRTTDFEGTCESGWTIAKLSSSLCWFVGFSTPKQAMVNSFRRSLIYPFHRSFRLSQQVLADLKMLINLGEQFMIKCLMEMHDIFLNDCRGFYVLNNLFIKDYIVYLMKWDKSVWQTTVEELNKIVIEKNDLGLHLLEIEALLDEVEENELTEKVSQLNVNDSYGQDSDDSDSDDDSSSSYYTTTEGDSD